MRWISTGGRQTGIAVAILLAAAGCSAGPAAVTTTGVPQPWYAAVADAIGEKPDVGSIALMDSGGPCAFGNSITVDGQDVTDVSDHGVVRLDGEIPAALCSWYEGTPIEITVARAEDDAEYASLVTGTRPRQQPGNLQTGQEIVVGARRLQVVRTTYPTNAAAGTDFEAFYLDEAMRGRVGLRVSNSTERSANYDETAVAADLSGFLNS